MAIVRVSHDFGRWPLARQTPHGDGDWSGHRFVGPGDPAAEAPDYWVVFNGLSEKETAFVDPRCVVLLTGEPTAAHTYPREFLAQFGLVLTTQPGIRGRRVLHGQVPLPWHVGVSRGADGRGNAIRLGYDDLCALEPEKLHEVSVVCSAKTDFPGQRRRLAFVESLHERLGERLHWYGRGIRPIDDKLDAVAPYRFHVCLENGVERDYWTEKLADAYLGLAFPIYWGCPNIHDYFGRDAVEAIAIDDIDAVVEGVERLLEDGVSEERQQALVEARCAVLDRYNFYPRMVDVLARCGRGGARREVQLGPEGAAPAGRRQRLRLR